MRSLLLVPLAALVFLACPPPSQPRDAGVGGSGGLGGGSSGGGSGGLGGGSSGGGSGGGSSTDAGPFTFTGHRSITYRLETHDEVRPGAEPITVSVPTDAGFMELATTPTGDGGFTVAGVPPGEVYVHVDSTWVVTTDRTVNLDVRKLGRPGTVAAPSTMLLSTTLSGLTPTNFPSVSMSTPNTGFSAEFFFVNGPFPAPLTSVTNEPASLDGALGGLPDGVSTDSTWVTQTVDRDPGVALDAGFEFYSSVEQSARLTGVTIAPDGGSLTATLTVNGPRVTQFTTVRAGEYAKWRTAVHPLAENGPLSVAVFPTPNPAGTAEGWIGYSGWLLDYYVSPFPAVDLPFALEFVDPFPSGWSRVYSYSVGFTAPTLLAGTTGGGLTGYLIDTRGQVQVASAPRLSPPAAMTVDGQPAAMGPLTLTSLQPTIAWSPPELGVASGYAVMIYRLTKSGTRTTRRLESTILTQGLSVRLPRPLQSGATYAVRISALFTPGVDLRAAPFAGGSALDYASADSLSSLWTAP